MIESTLFSLLSTSPSITAICNTRIYPVVLPTEVTLPAIHYLIVGGAVKPTNDTHGTIRVRVEVSCWGNTYGDAVNLRDAVVQSLDSYSGEGINIQYLMPQDLFDHELMQFRAICEFYVFASV